MSLKYKIVSEGDVQNVTVFVDGDLLLADSSHPNFDRIVEQVLAGDVDSALFDVEKYVADHFHAVSERVSVRGSDILFDGDVVNNALTEQLMRFLDEDIDEFDALVNFMEKVMTNPQQESRDQLYVYLTKNNFAITPDGDFIAYKGTSPDENGGYQSGFKGHAFVDGKEYVDSYIPNYVGAIVEMPRSEVVYDPRNSCSTGLHAGSYSYASGYKYTGGALLTVVVNPRDVVSIPNDSAEKMRVSRYTVIDIAEDEIKTAYYVAPVATKVISPSGSKRLCDEPGCGAKHHGRGLCRKHYGAKYKR